MTFLLSLALALYFMSGLLSLANSVRRKGGEDIALFRNPALAALFVAAVANALWIAWRWSDLGHPPFADLYGCFVLLAACVGIVSLTMELAVKAPFVGGVSSLAAAGLLVWSARYLGVARPLPPVLQSPFFAPHVVSYFIAYGALTVAAIAAVALLVARGASSENLRTLASALIDRAGRIGLPFLTLGMVLGAFWAQAAYADWWGWDPKEAWALVTWLLAVGWFHLWRAGRRGMATHALLVVAVCAMYFTLFGVGYLPTAEQSLHVYTQP